MASRRNTFALTLTASALAAAFGSTAAFARAPGSPITAPVTVSSNPNNDLFVNNGESDRTRVATNASGDFVVVWSVLSFASFTSEIYARAYTSSGAPRGPQFQVNTTTAENQETPAVAMAADGSFVIVWDSYGNDGNDHGIFAQRYGSKGVPLGGEFQVNSITTANQFKPNVAMAADGTFVTSWVMRGDSLATNGIYTRRFRANGTPFAAETRVSGRDSDTTAVALDDHGDYVVTWASYNSGGTAKWDVYARRYSGATANGGEFLVNATTADFQVDPAAAMDAAGNFVIVWQSKNQDGSGYGIYGRRYSSAGTASNEFRAYLNGTAGDQTHAEVAMDAQGDYTITWDSFDPNGPNQYVEALARRFTADGAGQGGSFSISGVTTSNQQHAGVALDADGDIVTAWIAHDNTTFSENIAARRFAGAEPVDVAVSLADGVDPVVKGGVLDYVLTVTNNHATVAPTGDPLIDAGIGAANTLKAVVTLPAGVKFQSADGTSWKCTKQPQNKVNCKYALALAPGAHAQATLHTKAPATAGAITATAKVTGAQVDPTAANDTDSEGTTVTN